MSKLIDENKQRCVSMSEIMDKVNVIAEKFKPEKIILFGSYAKGNAVPGSDVDLLVIMDSHKSSWELNVQISLAVKHSFPLDIIVRTPQDVSKRLKLGDFFLQDIIKDGKIVYERTR